MTKAEQQKLIELLNPPDIKDKIAARVRALNWVESQTPTVEVKSQRTKKQNDSFHLWLDMIEHEAENQGVTQDMLIKHTTQLRVTSEWLKSAVKQLISVLWGYTSTTQLKKQGDLDIVIDHVTDWLGKEMEVPEFPNDINKENTLKNIEMASKMNYPEDIYNGELPTI